MDLFVALLLCRIELDVLFAQANIAHDELRGLLPAELVDVHGGKQIHHVARVHARILGRMRKIHRGELGHVAARQQDLGMFAEADRLYVHDLHIPQNKRRNRIGNAVRLEQTKLLGIFERDFLARDRKIGIQRGNKVLMREILARVGVDLFAEGVDVFAAHTQSGSELVSAEFFEQIAAMYQRVHKVESLDRTAAALSDVDIAVALRAVKGNEDGRQTVFFGDARSDDSDDAVVPVVSFEHDDGITRKVMACLNAGIRLERDAVLLGLPLAVDVAEPRGKLIGFFARIGEKQLDRKARRADASRRVDAGRQRVADKSRGDLGCAGTLCAVGLLGYCLAQRHKSHALRFFDLVQTVGNDQAVFILDRHDIGDGADGNQIRESFADAAHRLLLGNVLVLCLKGAKQLEDHADARQFLKGIGTVGAAGIDHRGGCRQVAVALVVVGDDHVGASRERVCDLAVGSDARVHRDDEVGALVNEVIDRALAHAVALSHAVGDVVADIRAHRREVKIQDADRGHAVHIVVAVDHDLFLVGKRPFDAGDCLIHVEQQHRRVQKLLFHAQEAGCRLFGRIPAVGKQPRRQRADAE